MALAIHSAESKLELALRALTKSPSYFVAFLLLLNSIFQPYLGIVHDAQIYAGLVINRLDPGLLGQDLFFMFGSQDRFSAFSPLMAPLASVLGLKVAFFIGYLLSVTLFLAAMTRIVLRVWPNSMAAAVGLIVLATVRVGYGGFSVFHVLEPFLSARLPASALTLWAIANLLDRRWLRGGLCFALAFGIHPLMTLPGLVLWALVFAARRWGIWGTFVPVASATTLFAGVLAVPQLATKLFGEFDAQWLDYTRKTNGYQFPQDWRPEQWAWNLIALGGLAAAAWTSRRNHPDRARLLANAAMIGAAGLFGSLVCTQLPYAMLLKGQMYRALWLPLALTPPAFLDLAWRAWRNDTTLGRLMAVGLILTLATSTYLPSEMLCLLIFVPASIAGYMIFAKGSSLADKVGGGSGTGIVAGLAALGIVRIGLLLERIGDFQDGFSPLDWGQMVLINLGPGVIVPFVLAVTAAMCAWMPRRALVLIAASIALHVSLFSWTLSDDFNRANPRSDDGLFVERFLRAKSRELGRSLEVYANQKGLGLCWLDWRTRSYYSYPQTVGFVFNRDTAIEGRRRAYLVAPFEADAIAIHDWKALPRQWKDLFESWFEVDVANSAPPQVSDLLKLAQDPAVDVIVLFGVHFDHLAAAKQGDVSIYDCRQLRASRETEKRS